MTVYSFAQVVQITLIDLWSRVASILPDLLGALIVVVIGLIVAPIFGGIAKRIVDILKIDALAEKVGVKEMVSGYSPKLSISSLIGRVVKWFFVLTFIMAGAEILKWDRITEFLNEIIFYIPQVLIAIVILVFGSIAGKFFEAVVVRTLQGADAAVEDPALMGKITRWSFIVFAVLAALLQLGIAPSLIQILFAGVVLALAISFGLGGQSHADKLLKNIYSGSKKK